jgi:tellurite resistance protein
MLQRIEPFAETMFIVMAADEDLAPTERTALNGAIHILAGGATPAAQIDAMIDRFQQDLDVQGAEARLAGIGVRFGTDREDREIAFTLAAAMALADEELDWRENQTLLWIQEYFGLSSRRIASLVESIE